MRKSHLGFLAIVLLFSVSALAQKNDRDSGIDLYREEKFADSIALLEKAVAANEGDTAAWMFLAGAYVHTREEGKASKAFQKSRVTATVPQPQFDKSVNVTYKPRATYTEASREKLSSGTVRIAVEFRSDGRIGFAYPLPTMLDRDLVTQSVDAAKGIRFEPAVKDGKPVTVIKLVEYGFFVR